MLDVDDGHAPLHHAAQQQLQGGLVVPVQASVGDCQQGLGAALRGGSAEPVAGQVGARAQPGGLGGASDTCKAERQCNMS